MIDYNWEWARPTNRVPDLLPDTLTRVPAGGLASLTSHHY